MSIASRIGKIITGILIIAGAVLLMMLPWLGYIVIAAILGISLLISGIGSLIYYFTMSRHMVGGRDALYTGLIKVDLALFTLSVSDVPKVFVMLYLVAVFGVTGLLHVLRSLEARKRNAPSWHYRFISGIIYLTIALLCLIFSKNTVVMVVVYCIGLILTGLGRIASAFYRAKVVYIQ